MAVARPASVRPLPILALLSLVLAGCVVPPDEGGADVSASARPIVGGTVDHGDPAVVGLALESSSEQWFCTGTLISPKVILTAAHCVDMAQGGYVYFGTNMLSLFGQGSDPDYIDYREVSDVYWHDSWNTNDVSRGYDIGLILMNRAAPTGVAPLQINRRAVTSSDEGKTVRLVGFGDTYGDAGDAGTKRQTTTQLAQVYANQLEYGTASHNTCQGDSGGPNFMNLGSGEVVASVTSWGYEGCSGTSYGTDVYDYVSWIDAWVSSHDRPASCAAGDGCASGCSAPDPDCPCNGDGFCTSACLDPGTDPDCPSDCATNNYCYAACPAHDYDCDRCGGEGTCMDGCGGGDPDCSPAACGSDGFCDEACVLRDPDCPLAGVGGACGVAEDCESGWCLPAPDDSRLAYCTSPCDPGVGCPGGMDCTATTDGYLCIYARTPGALGAACWGAEDCLSGLCAGTCIDYCGEGDSCPSGFACTQAEGGEHICTLSGGGGGGGGGGWCGVAAGAGAAGRRGVPGGAGAVVLALVALVGLRRRRG